MNKLCDVPINLQDHNYSKGRTISARHSERARKPAACKQCPCCRGSQVPKPGQQHSSSTASRPQKRKRTSEAHPSKSSAGHPEVLHRVPTPPPSNLAVDIPAVLNLVPRPSTIPPAELPVVSNVVPSPQPSTAPLQHDGPLMIHNHSVEEYQRIYHEVVDNMLRDKNGQLRPYSLALGRRIKQKLWERLERPMTTSSVNEDGLTHVDVSYRVGVYPPLYQVDTSGEPEPEWPPKKRRNN